LNGGAGGGNAAYAGLAVLQDEFADAGQREGVPGVFLSQRGQVIEDFDAGLLGQSRLGREFRCQL
jgi:hypothetical protein